jgi:RimJ/RimL family protein N-acetyltransferase
MHAQSTLRTRRLVLRPFVPADAEEVRRLAGERAVAATTLHIPYPYEPCMVESWIASHGPGFARGEIAVFAITDAESGALLGCVGLTIAAAAGRAELGYWIGAPYWGRGYCTEAGRAVLEYAFKALALRRVHACHMGSNPASGRVMQKLGMTLEGRRRAHLVKWDRIEDAVDYGILREEFDPAARA